MGRVLERLAPPEDAPGPAHPEGWSRARAGRAALTLAAVVAIAWTWLGPFVSDPRRFPPGPDLAWYTWRAELLTEYPPRELILADGPLDVFGGGYRVVTPLLAAMLRRVADLDPSTVAVLLIAGRQVLLALALGAVAYRIRRDALAFVCVAAVSAAALFLRPFVGYVDNVVALLLATGALWFLPDAMTRWPARVAVFGLCALLVFTHPPTAAIFIAVLLAAVGLRSLLTRSLVSAVRAEGWLAAAAVGGALVGVAGWWGGLWGPRRTFRDAMHIPPYPSSDFLDATLEQVRALQLAGFAPLAVAGVAALVLLGRRRFVSDPLPRALVAWLLPLAGVLGFYVGLHYPYKRFLNSTVAPIALAGLGLWAVVAFGAALVRRGTRERRWWRPVLGIAGIAAGIGVAAIGWRDASRMYQQQDPWAPRDVRVSLAAVRGYLAEEGVRRPLVFVVSAGRRQGDNLVWGGIWRGNWSQIRAGLPGAALPDSHVYFGAVRDLVRDRPTVTGNRLIDLISEASHSSIRESVGDREPLVILLRRFNRRLGNDRFLGPPRSARLGGGAFVLRGKAFAAPDRAALLAAQVAAAREEESLSAPVDRTSRPGHLLRVGLGLGVLFLVPGLLAARWFGVRDLPSAVGVVPVLSVGLTSLAGIVVLGAVRRPLTAGIAWAVAGLACAIGAALSLASFTRAPAPAGGEQADASGERGHDGA